jgi:hypothetical protein
MLPIHGARAVVRVCERKREPERWKDIFLYHWRESQHASLDEASGVQGRFGEVLGRFITPAQQERIGKALAPILC